MTKATVYYSREITPEALVRIFERLGVAPGQHTAVKVSTGEAGGHNYLKPELIGQLVKRVQGTIVECNTAYKGQRNTAKDHLRVAKEHGFLDIAAVDIMDAEGEKEIPVPNGRQLDVDIIGKNFDNYDMVIDLSHFKGHAMGGFGGAIKNLSIGVASRHGKAYIHSAGKTRSPRLTWLRQPPQNDFLESMAEAAQAVAVYCAKRQVPIVYLNVMNNLSVDCDCDASPEDPCMKDIGIFAALDPVAIDQACIDQIWQSDDPGRDHFIERVERQNGRYILPYAAQIGLGTTEYDLVEVGMDD